MSFPFDSSANLVSLGSKVDVVGFIRGTNDSIKIGNARNPSRSRLEICSDNNVIEIKDAGQLRDLSIYIGSHFPANWCSLDIAENFSSEENVNFFLCNSGNRCVVGANCMFSNSITVRCGESPHLLFDAQSGRYLDEPEGVIIGSHVWVGEKAYICRKAAIPDDTVVGAMSVVTRRFSEHNTIWQATLQKWSDGMLYGSEVRSCCYPIALITTAIRYTEANIKIANVRYTC